LLASGDALGAVGPLQAAVAKNSEYFPAHYNLGNAYASLGRFPESVAEFKAAVRLNPTDSMAQTNWGAALAETGALAEAREHLKKAVQLDPHNTVAQDNLSEVESRLAGGGNP
jgi:Flp pilus assembly protein TadD